MDAKHICCPFCCNWILSKEKPLPLEVVKIGTPGWIRTSGLQSRSLSRYPTALRALLFCCLPDNESYYTTLFLKLQALISIFSDSGGKIGRREIQDKNTILFWRKRRQNERKFFAVCRFAQKQEKNFDLTIKIILDILKEARLGR